jgi:stage II sporulation protein AA (anti-sigma F factor antagonist)
MCLRLEGQLSGDSALVLLRAVEPVFVSPHPPHVKLLMDGIHYMDSTGVGVIIAIIKQVRDRGGKLEIVGLSDAGSELLQILELAGLPEVVTVNGGQRRAGKPGEYHES